MMKGFFSKALFENIFIRFFFIIIIILNFLATSSLAFCHCGSLTKTDLRDDIYAKVLIRQLGHIQGNQRIALNVIDSNLLYVEFYIDATLVFTDREPPWECVYNFGEIERMHEVRAIGYFKRDEIVRDNAQEQKTPYTLESDMNEFKVTIISPAANSNVIGNVVIEADVSTPPDIQVEKVEFYIDGNLLYSDKQTPYTFQCDVGEEFNRRIIETIAHDNKGKKVSDAIFIMDRGGRVYEANVDLVTLDITVTDEEGKYILDLNKNDFTVYEDGRRQRISHFTKMEKPLAVGILIDISGSMTGKKLQKAKEGAEKFVTTLKEEDKAFVMSFNDDVKVKLDYTNNIGALNHSINGLQASSATALNKAVYQAIEKLKYERGRKVVILLSDGYDTIGELDEEEVLEAAKKADVKIYSIGIFSLSFVDPDQLRQFENVENRVVGEAILQSFSDWTGGAAYFPNSLYQLEKIYARIAQELRQQYSLGYTSNNKRKDGTWRSIGVKLRNDKLQARTKKGYYAPKNE